MVQYLKPLSHLIEPNWPLSTIIVVELAGPIIIWLTKGCQLATAKIYYSQTMNFSSPAHVPSKLLGSEVFLTLEVQLID